MKTFVAGLAAVLLALLVVVGAGARPLLTVSITSAPPDPSSSTAASFAFSSDLRDATFTCSLDEARATPCASPMSYTGLSLGRHKFVVTALRGRESSSMSHTWTIVPPPPPKTAPLLVSISGGGTVASASAGIACPGDCSETYVLGTQVALNAKASAGFAFAGWTGACTGGAGCIATIAGQTFVKAVFERSGKAPRLFVGDGDGDGVGNAADACPGRPRPTKPFFRGCGLADMLHDADALLSKLEDYDYPGGYASRFDGIGGLKPIHGDLMKNLRLMRKGADQVEHGGVCGGAAITQRGVRGMRGLVGKSKKLIGALQVNVRKKPSGGQGDAGVKDFEWAELHYLQGIVEDLAGEAARVGKAFGTACRSLGKLTAFEGVVESTDDANGSLRLANGTVVQLPVDRYGNDVAEGALLRITGRRAPGGVVAESVDLLSKGATQQLIPQPCMSLRIAPVQPFTKPNPVLHDPRGYRGSDFLWLEEQMRVAASPEQCADKAGFRYSLLVEATAQGWSKKTIAPDLDANDDPVPLGISASSAIWTITVTHRRQGNNCPPPSDQAPQPFLRTPASVAKSYPCPIVVVGTTTYKVGVRPFASYGTATYEKAAFDLESNAFDTGRVTGVTGVHSSIANPGFEADGYQITGTQSAGFMSKIATNQLFAVWPEAWYGFPSASPLDSVGVDHYAGLVWPRVVGSRNGKPFRYAAQLPTILTDLLPGCPAGSCFYRLPWKAGDTVETGQGNGPNAFSHTGNQQFAFDFSMPDKSTIYATRGGIVGDVVESNVMNFNPCADNNGNGIKGDEVDKQADGPSNFVRIDHQDGTFSYYAHLDANSVVPADGSVIERGAELAKIDNTGRSCGPHLHYQVAVDSTNTIYGQTTEICFEGWALVIFDYLFSNCFIPKTGNLLISTNG